MAGRTQGKVEEAALTKSSFPTEQKSPPGARRQAQPIATAAQTA